MIRLALCKYSEMLFSGEAKVFFMKRVSSWKQGEAINPHAPYARITSREGIPHEDGGVWYARLQSQLL